MRRRPTATPGRLGPLLLGTDELVGGVVAGGQLQVVVVQPEVAEQAEAEVQQVGDLRRRLFLGDVGVRVILGHAAHPSEPVDDAGLLKAVHGAELEQPQRQVTVRATTGPVDEVVHRTVHRLEGSSPLELHRREHAVRVVRQVPAGVTTRPAECGVLTKSKPSSMCRCQTRPNRGAARPLGKDTAQASSSGKLNRSSSAPSFRWSRLAASSSRVRYAFNASLLAHAVP